MKKGDKFWCWWKSRNLYYTGRIINGEYEFRDGGITRQGPIIVVTGAITMVSKDSLKMLEAR